MTKKKSLGVCEIGVSMRNEGTGVVLLLDERGASVDCRQEAVLPGSLKTILRIEVDLFIFSEELTPTVTTVIDSKMAIGKKSFFFIFSNVLEMS